MVASNVLTIQVENAPLHIQTVLDTWQGLFGLSVTTTYISELQHNGHMISAGWELVVAPKTGCRV